MAAGAPIVAEKPVPREVRAFQRRRTRPARFVIACGGRPVSVSIDPRTSMVTFRLYYSHEPVEVPLSRCFTLALALRAEELRRERELRRDGEPR